MLLRSLTHDLPAVFGGAPLRGLELDVFPYGPHLLRQHKHAPYTLYALDWGG